MIEEESLLRETNLPLIINFVKASLALISNLLFFVLFPCGLVRRCQKTLCNYFSVA